MTTIAYRNGILASESRLTEKSFVWTDRCKKIWRLPDGSLFGASGENDGGELLLRAMRDGKEKMPELSHTKGLHIKKDGSIWIFEGEIWVEWPEEFAAIGSGKRYAMAAMKAGADAPTAVRIAKEMDVYSGGEVQSLALVE